jgi:hypothetical protein
MALGSVKKAQMLAYLGVELINAGYDVYEIIRSAQANGGELSEEDLQAIGEGYNSAVDAWDKKHNS